MQTFLPYPGFAASAAVLDDRRLGKQRVETFQVLRALTWPSYGWKHHPAVRMWRGFTTALVAYGVAVCDEWTRRGHADAVRPQLLAFAGDTDPPDFAELLRTGRLPPWVGQDAVHVSHQSALVRKDPDTYRVAFPDVPDDLPYVWPSPAFPRWPVRRSRAEPLSVDEALTLLGYETARPEQATAMTAVRHGEDVTLRLPPGAGATSAGVLAGLVTPGTTLWVTPGGAPVDRPVARPPAQVRATGRVASSIAREPSADDRAAMDAESLAEPEFRFVRAAQVRTLSTDVRDGVGLVVLDGTPAAVRRSVRRAGISAPLLALMPG